METRTNIGSLELKNPVLTASGTFGYGLEFCDFVDLNALGGFVVKGTTATPREGNPYPRMAETPLGMLNAVGLQNKGVDYLIEHILPQIKEKIDYTQEIPTRLIVNVSGSTIDEYVEVAQKLNACPEVDAIEVNISCPNVKQGGMAFGTVPAMAAEVTSAVRKAFDRCIIVKLSPNVTDIASMAEAVEGAGADSVSLINTLLGMAVDVEKRKAVLSTVTGGLSGPCVKPVALRMVWQVAKRVRIPVIGIGGIRCTTDALEFLMAGASAIEIGTANFVNPAVTQEVAEGLQAYGDRQKLVRIQDIIGII
ncbi:MAG: dihydroorotate dehydrogenase [Bacteroides sp.]|nr:dihydroorotate dehydrogenase [Ruminococcus flavefaciens]MCM1554202.1 dihydroorotate dehydrogenase [Bacteroides sp.]